MRRWKMRGWKMRVSGKGKLIAVKASTSVFTGNLYITYNANELF